MLRHVFERAVESLEHRHLTAEQEPHEPCQWTQEHLAVYEVRPRALGHQLEVVLAADAESRAYPSKLSKSVRPRDADAKTKVKADVRSVVKRRGATLGRRPLGGDDHRIPLVEPGEVSQYPPHHRRRGVDVDLRANVRFAHRFGR